LRGPVLSLPKDYQDFSPVNFNEFSEKKSVADKTAQILVNPDNPRHPRLFSIN